MDFINFDHAATTPIHPEVFEVLSSKLRDLHGNPSSSHLLGQKARNEIEQARNKIASLMKVNSSEIFFTSGATEAINMLLKGAIERNKITHVIVSPIEHPAVLNTIKSLKNLLEISYCKLNRVGEIDLIHLENLLKTNANSLVAIMSVNNEIGVINPISDISALCKKYAASFFCDMVQAVGKTPLDLSVVDFASFTAHKFYGPKGVGFAYISSKNHVNPLLYGGGQEQNMRAGTENIASIIAMAKALEIVFREYDNQLNQVDLLSQYFSKEIVKAIPNIEFVGNSKMKVPHIVNFTILDYPSMDSLYILLDMNKICISSGSACSSGSVQKSHVIREIRDDITHSIRVSFGSKNTTKEIDTFIQVLKDHIGNQIQ